MGCFDLKAGRSVNFQTRGGVVEETGLVPLNFSYGVVEQTIRRVASRGGDWEELWTGSVGRRETRDNHP